ncbi:MAG: glucuronate isomerase [Candidatus Ancillula trichonymphae]|jgi:glucuronate isomerase|nr:glucuronate isomerase [Candidatus Ancillula trichonymphae]
MEFLNDNFLLNTQFAVDLYHNWAKNLPIIDYHCHLEPQIIYNNQNPENITKLWITGGDASSPVGDHYKWRLMRAAGYSEDFVTGTASDLDKFQAFAVALESALGNPILEWSHLELRRFFGIETVLNSKTSLRLYDELNEQLKTDNFKPRNMIANSNVDILVTTDDPADDLILHDKLKAEEQRFQVFPAFRPDPAMNVFKSTFAGYVDRLGESAKITIKNLSDLEKALTSRIDFFHSKGTRLADHGIETFYYGKASAPEVDKTLEKALEGQQLSAEEIAAYHTYLQKFLAKEYAKRNWIMQMHINAFRDLNTPAFSRSGPNTGHDAMTDTSIAQQVAAFFDDLEIEGAQTSVDTIPRTMLYSLNKNDFLPLIAIGGTHGQNVNGQGVKQKFQLGPAWWFNDTYTGMYQQLEIFSEQSLLGNFTGMLTDSRSLLSYPRHEYFRRILCEFLGNLEKTGRIPSDIEAAGQVVQNISYYNAKNYFGLGSSSNDSGIW